MAPPLIDFHQIRQHHGSQNGGFEELVCQLAMLETPAGRPFHRKGIGADGGLECYRIETDASETGWQAKYFFELGTNEASQLTASFNTAMATHPALKRFIVCLPFTLPDGRVEDRKSQKDRWNDWVEARLAAFPTRSISIELWSAFELGERLSRDEPLYVGRRTYWFDTPHFGQDWFRERFAITRAALGRRYAPEVNVELPIRKAIAAFVRDPNRIEEIHRWADMIDEARHRGMSTIRSLLDTSLADDVAALEAGLAALSAAIRAAPLEPTHDIPFDVWRERAKALSAIISRCSAALWEARVKADPSDDRVRTALHYVNQIWEAVGTVVAAMDESGVSLANQRRLLLTGDAGIGKSHLLADVADHHIAHGHPAVILLGGGFADADPWHQIAQQLGLTTTAPDALLGALDSAGEASGTRAIVMIDAINERNGIAVWSDRLAAFLATTDRFPHVAVLVSCRTTFLTYIVRDLDEAQLPRIAHPGFAGKAAEAARRYLDQRGIVRMAAPNFAPEFENPLFLRTCCDMLERSGESSLPKGLAGVSSIFDFYQKSVVETINQRMGLLARRNVVGAAFAALIQAMVDACSGYLPFDQVDALLEAAHPSQGRAEQSLFFHLESEGAITVEPIRENGAIVEMIRFTFERISDHAIAQRLLELYLDPAAPSAAFAPGGPLSPYVGRGAEQHAGIAEAFAVQLPERTGMELIDAVPDVATRWRVIEGFKLSLRWRRQDMFTERTLELVDEWASAMGSDAYLETLLGIATEPDNRFNADHLDRWLRPLPMPERDELWSTRVTHLAEEDDNAVVTLIEWVLANGLEAIDPDRARLATITLAWLTSLSHRWVRDMATKALATLFIDRRALAAETIGMFGGVDDAYVIDRVLAAAYGAAMRRSGNDGLAELARAAFEAVFRREPLTPHALVRDHARGLVELAAHRGVLPDDLRLDDARPPYRRGACLEAIDDATLDGFVQDYGGSLFRDGICSSAIEDGDFARYEIDPLADNFLRLPREDFGRSMAELYDRWRADMVDPFPERGPALDAALELARQAEATPHDFSRWDLTEKGDDPNPREVAEAARDEAIATFERLLDPEEVETFRRFAAIYIRSRMWDASASLFLPTYKGDQARRWVAWRAHELGWTPARFAAFDRQVPDQGRMDHRIERIGKKYQWIAFHELTGRLADIALVKAGWHDDPILYDGPWRLGTREMDPSLLVTRTEQHDSDRTTATWWAPHVSRWRAAPPQVRIAWAQDPDRDMPDPVKQIGVTDGEGRDWLVLSTNVGCNQWAMVDGERVIHRTAWHKISSLLVPKRDTARLIRQLEKSARDRDHPNEVEMPRSAYLGEYPWHPAFAGTAGSWTIGSRRPITVHASVVKWYVERSGHDYAVEQSFNLTIPAPAMMRGLGLRLAEGRALTYAAADGRILFKDPSSDEPGFSAAVVERAAFERFLADQELDVVWIFTGEKSAHGGRRHGRGWGGMLEYWGVYRLDQKAILGSLSRQYTEPRAEQLEEMLAMP